MYVLAKRCKEIHGKPRKNAEPSAALFGAYGSLNRSTGRHVRAMIPHQPHWISDYRAQSFMRSDPTWSSRGQACPKPAGNCSPMFGSWSNMRCVLSDATPTSASSPTSSSFLCLPPSEVFWVLLDGTFQVQENATEKPKTQQERKENQQEPCKKRQEHTRRQQKQHTAQKQHRIRVGSAAA